jgi:hypothetical protein
MASQDGVHALCFGRAKSAPKRSLTDLAIVVDEDVSLRERLAEPIFEIIDRRGLKCLNPRMRATSRVAHSTCESGRTCGVSPGAIQMRARSAGGCDAIDAWLAITAVFSSTPPILDLSRDADSPEDVIADKRLNAGRAARNGVISSGPVNIRTYQTPLVRQAAAPVRGT